MSGSIVFYRFKAQKDPSTIHFEGTGISVWDLKKDILAENKLGKGADFDFAIYNADTNDGEGESTACARLERGPVADVRTSPLYGSPFCASSLAVSYAARFRAMFRTACRVQR